MLEFKWKFFESCNTSIKRRIKSNHLVANIGENDNEDRNELVRGFFDHHLGGGIFIFVVANCPDDEYDELVNVGIEQDFDSKLIHRSMMDKS
jgi:hypothetical protein